MTNPQPKKGIPREVFYAGAAVVGLALIVQSDFSFILVGIYVVLVLMALIAEVVGR